VGWCDRNRLAGEHRGRRHCGWSCSREAIKACPCRAFGLLLPAPASLAWRAAHCSIIARRRAIACEDENETLWLPSSFHNRGTVPEVSKIVLFASIGFAAQAIDGALGMAYGVTATTMLLGLGVAPPIASASVHTAEMFTTGVSGAAHWRLGNVDVIVARELAVAGIAGGATGAYLSTALPGTVIRPFVSLYLLAVGVVIVWRAIGRFGNDRNTAAPISMPRRVIPLGVVSGLLDAIGGGDGGLW
jgi:Sulfite exporter TauE/SafE